MSMYYITKADDVSIYRELAKFQRGTRRKYADNGPASFSRTKINFSSMHFKAQGRTQSYGAMLDVSLRD